MNQITSPTSADSSLLYEDAETKFRGIYVPRTQDTGPRTAIMIVPDWRGLSPFVQTQARQFADSGHDVAIVDLYGDGLYADHESQASPLIKFLIEHRASGVSRLNACLAAFRKKVGESTKVVLLAYSIGGMVSLDFGRSGATVAGIVLCSALLKTAVPGGAIKIPSRVLALHGTRDVVCPAAAVQELIGEMDQAGNDFQIVLYGRTHHAFYNPEAGTDETARLVYSERADRSARKEIEQFIAQF